MPDFDNEEQFSKIIKDACEPAAPSPEFQSRLNNLVSSEAGRHSIRTPRRPWASPLVWASTALAAALILLSLVLWYQPSGQSPLVIPEPSTSPVSTPTPETTPSTEPTSGPSPTPSVEPSATPSAEPSPTPTMLASTGTLQIKVTDAPPEREVYSILVTLSNIRVYRESDEADGEGEWITVIEEPVSFDLIFLKENGVEQILGDAEIDIGYYTQIRMDITEVEAVVEGEEEVIFPSEVLKTAGEFEIEEGKTTTLLFDFDAAKSLVFTGEGKVMFKPVVKLIVTGPE